MGKFLLLRVDVPGLIIIFFYSLLYKEKHFPHQYMIINNNEKKAHQNRETPPFRGS